MLISYNLKHKKKQNKTRDFRSMPFKELAFFADIKRKVVKNHVDIRFQRQKLGTFLHKSVPLIVFENFQICFILHAKVNGFFINIQVT